jgi:hypothetical protein
VGIYCDRQRYFWKGVRLTDRISLVTMIAIKMMWISLIFIPYFKFTSSVVFEYITLVCAKSSHLNFS